ncbi:MAG: chemotaxis protein [Campylobacterota bacterium]|nr:chemotaxis protein [Campylobacterota bacterium]
MSILDKVDEATNLAKNNELQLLVFKVDASSSAPYYAINVFKTREVVETKRHHLTLMPSSNPLLEGTITLRGMQIPVLNLPQWVNVHFTNEQKKASNFLICDFNGINIGLRIMFAHRVIKKNWSEMHAPDSYRTNDGGVVMNHTKLEDGSLCLILDYEKLLSEVIPQAMVNIDSSVEHMKNIDMPEKLKTGVVLIAEDSKTAQSHLKQVFTRTGVGFKIFENGKLLMDHINSLNSLDNIAAIVTDIEMPEMSGFTVLQKLQEDSRTKNIPKIVNSSMTGENNKREAEKMGASGFVNKTKSQDIIPLIVSIMNGV